MSKKHVFDDKTILSTPNPIHSSSMSSDTGSRTGTFIDEVFRRASCMDSLKQSAEQLKRERMLATSSLNRMDSIDSKIGQSAGHNNLTGLPSRFLRPSELSPTNSLNFLHTESTINESDLLLLGNSSTPRDSLLSNLEFVMKEPSRPSTGQSLSRLATSMMNTDYDLNKLIEKCHKAMDTDLGSFCSAEEAVEQFEQDEMSWKQKKDIPAPLREFSIDQNCDLSVGSFFKQRSDDLSKWLAKSPQKIHPPVPLIETSFSDLTRDNTVNIEDDSLSISAIAKILSDTKQTPTKATDYLLKPKKKSESSTFIKTSRISETKPSTEFRKSPICELYDNKEEKRKSIEATKENVNTLNIKDVSPDFQQEKSSFSSRNSSALSNLPNGKLPIATTKTEIIWDCVKLGKNASQDFIIKNKSSSRVAVKCAVSNPSFRLFKEGTDINVSSTLKVILHPYESRTLTVTFAPTTLGAAVDHLNFTPMDSSQKQLVKQFIKLYGYGGHGSTTVSDVVKDTTGKFLLSLGNIDCLGTMKNRFILRNHGTLPSFAYVGFISSGLYLFSNVKITPQTVVLLPGEEREVVVTYDPKKEDINFVQSKLNHCVIDMGKITVIHGTEVNRGRLRKLCKKAKELNLEINAAVDNLVRKFPGEVMPNDLRYLKEPVSSMEEVFRLINTEEIIVTLEQDLDRTLMGQFQNETAMFHSLCENTNPDMFENTIRSDTCNIEPSKIILTPPEKVSDRIFLTNNSKEKLYFEIHSAPEGLRFKPEDGTVDSNETFVVQVTCSEVCNEKSIFKVKILVDSEAFEVDVKVVFIGHNPR